MSCLLLPICEKLNKFSLSLSCENLQYGLIFEAFATISNFIIWLLFVGKVPKIARGTTELELSQQLKRIQIPVSALLAFLHSLVTTFTTLCTSLSSYLFTTISMTPTASPIAQKYKYIYCSHHNKKKTPAQTSHATPAPPCRPPWWPHIPHWAFGHLKLLC